MQAVILSYMDRIRYAGYSKPVGDYFILATIIFKDLDSAEQVNKSLRELKKDIESAFKVNSIKETKGKEAILKKVSQLKFKYSAVVIDNNWLRKEPSSHPDESLFMLITNQLFLRKTKRFSNATLFIDRGDKSFIKNYNKYLQKKLDLDLKGLIGPLRIADSHKNNLVLLTDLICRVIYHKYDKQDDSLYNLLRKREEDLWRPY